MSEKKTAHKRSVSPYRQWLRLFVRLLIVAAILLIGFLVWNNWDKLAPEAVLDWAETRFGGAPIGTGFPVKVEGNSVLAMGEVNQHLIMLTDTNLQFYNSSATRVVTRPHAFSDPTLHTAGRYALITETGGSRFRLDSRRETVLDKELENRKIYASCLLPSGMVGVVTDSASQSYLCEIQVYNRNGKSLFTYQSRKYLITNISLAANGNGIAAVGTTAEGGILKSVLLVFDFSDDEPQEYAGNDLLLYDVNCFSSGTIAALGDKEVWVLPARGNTVDKMSLEGYEPIGYSASQTLSGIVLQRAGTTGGGYVWTVDSSGNIWKSDLLEGTFRNVSSKNSRLMVLTDSQLYVLGRASTDKQMPVPSDALLTTEFRDQPLLLTLSELRRADTE